MQKDPFFSIVIPTLNEEFFLPHLLEDLKKQKEKNFEVIVVDGDSDDRTRHQAEQFEPYFHLTIYNVKKRNLSFQRNFGAKKSKGGFLIFLDADMRIGPTFINELMIQINKSRYLIYLPFLYPQEGSDIDKVSFYLNNILIWLSHKLFIPFSTAGVMIIQKNFFHFIGGFLERKEHEEKLLFPEDHELFLRVSKNGVRAQLMPHIKAGYSLRRYKKDGRLIVVHAWVISAFQTMFTGKLNKKIPYEMGGHLYAPPKS